ncbi:MAG: SURF1 family protein [Gammaproteobacteria bacterium]|nr:SURF1 family protein [Gammaproteobacteria bacterium]
MLIGRRRFLPTWWSVALTAAGVSLFVALGMWQLERAELKEAIELKFEQRLALPYRAFSSIDDLVDIEYRKLILQGRYDNTRSLLVDNQLHRGRAGYYVVTPLQLRDSDHLVLVNRGWVAWGESRDELAPIPDPVSTGGVAGIAYFPSEPALLMGDVEAPTSWPLLVSHIDTEALQARFDGRLLPLVLWLAPEQQGAYVRVWKPVWMRPEKSRAYATQWLAFAVVVLVFFIILNLRKIE